MNKPSIYFARWCSDSTSYGISALSNLMEAEKPSIKNWFIGKDSSIFVSDTTKISIFPCNKDFRASD